MANEMANPMTKHFNIDTNVVKAEVDGLLEARNFIADKDNWCTGSLGRIGGLPTTLGMFDIKRATQVCAMGTMRKFELSTETMLFVDNVAWKMYNHAIATVNDYIGHEAILNVFDEAIRQAKEL